MNNKVLNKEALRQWILSKMISLTNNMLATTPGVSAMDAAQGPVIQGQIDEINSNFGGVRFGTTEDGKPGWKDGADTVHPFSSDYTINVPGNVILNGYATGNSYQSDLKTASFTLKIKINNGTLETYGGTTFMTGEYGGGFRGKVTFGKPTISKDVVS